jgi:hypothetical protein
MNRGPSGIARPRAALPQTGEYYNERRFKCSFAKEGCPYAQGISFSSSDVVVFGILLGRMFFDNVAAKVREKALIGK